TANVSKVDFKKAIFVDAQGSTRIVTKAKYIWYFSKKFNIDYPKEVLLDMLSFDVFDNQEDSGLEYLASKLEHKDIVKRMLENLSEGIVSDRVLIHHFAYLTQNRITHSYSYIQKEINNSNRDEYFRLRFVDVFYANTGRVKELKAILKDADKPIRRTIIDKLITNNDKSYVVEFLQKQCVNTQIQKKWVM
ncbi:MAG: hypothetical protein K8S56_07345, partial [Candidatus Cloacimonetes bacterium]|nr:hypothetical protein [Candidatus Cloacimonadota bacterium]